MTFATPFSHVPASRFGGHPKRARIRTSSWLIGSSQAAVMIAALASRLYAMGWWLVIVVMTGGILIILAPTVIATVTGIRALHARSLSVRIATAAALVVMDIALLISALTFPDFTDQADTNYVPIVSLIRHEEVSADGVGFYNAVALPAFATHLAAAGATLVLFLASWWRERR